jgi:O-antigen biosynthesis protein
MLTNPKVIVFGKKFSVEQTSGHIAQYQTDKITLDYHDGPIDQSELHEYDLFVTIGGNCSNYAILFGLPLYLRRKWVHFNDSVVDSNVGSQIYNAITNYILGNQFFLSVYTSTYNTSGRVIKRTYESLKRQTYPEWEWVVVDDGSSDDTYEVLKELEKKDARVRIYSFKNGTGGNIGEAKHRAVSMCRGEWLIELDHDDVLVDNALEDVFITACATKADFIYSDWAEITEDHRSLIYGETFGFGFGYHYDVSYKGINYKACKTPDINPKTIRHIVGVPNHLRAWKKSFYHKIGGYNRYMKIVDDYELLVRTFLNGTMVRIPRMCYLQYQHGGNSQNSNRKDIQRRVQSVSKYYDKAISDRFDELGVHDWVKSGVAPETPGNINITMDENKLSKWIN